MKKSVISYPTGVKEAFISVTCLEEIASKMVSHLDLVILCFLSHESCFLCFKINKIVCLWSPPADKKKKRKRRRRRDNCKWHSFWWKQKWWFFLKYHLVVSRNIIINIYLINQLFLKASMYSSKIFVFSFVLLKYI